MQNFNGTVAVKKAKTKQLEEQQKLRENILCEGEALENVFQFKYLGSMFVADGSQEPDIQ